MLISTESAGNLVGDNANECKHWITGIFYFEWSNSSVHLITLASNKINSRFDRLLPDYLRDTVEWITKYNYRTSGIPKIRIVKFIILDMKMRNSGMCVVKDHFTSLSQAVLLTAKGTPV
ncbi:hypothetical protein WUBG_01526 [Wuchereria bancrofti]|uniref:Uncharacterized protein n=1 Tax=Wuchereria bancrofti TaxID=6293 RepID=J9EY99_WUCBA|nr:hypothetical protein WUBG_01526 [Wuchereria bancrofti]